MRRFANIFKRKIDLYNLISYEKVKELEIALKSGNDPNLLDDYGQTPVFRVVYNPCENQVSMLELLIEYGADLNFRKKTDGETVIHNAKSIQIAEILLKNGADISAKTINECTPLHKATSAEMAQFFIDKGIDVDSKDKFGSTALFDAVYFGLELVDCLLKNGATTELKNKNGLTPLICLAQTEYADKNDNIEIKQICDRLINNGANVDSTDNEGKSAIQHAQEVGNNELAEYLENKKRKHNRVGSR